MKTGHKTGTRLIRNNMKETNSMDTYGDKIGHGNEPVTLNPTFSGSHVVTESMAYVDSIPVATVSRISLESISPDLVSRSPHFKFSTAACRYPGKSTFVDRSDVRAGGSRSCR